MFQLLFTYGMLMDGLSGHTFLLDSEFLGYGILYGIRLVQLNDGYPAVLDGESSISGEVYRVDDQTIDAIDYFEGFNPKAPEESLFIRKTKPIRLLPYGDFVDACVYILNAERVRSFVDIPFYNWREFVKKLLNM